MCLESGTDKGSALGSGIGVGLWVYFVLVDVIYMRRWFALGCLWSRCGRRWCSHFLCRSPWDVRICGLVLLALGCLLYVGTLNFAYFPNHPARSHRLL